MKRYIYFILGICILTLGVSLIVISDMGAGSWDAINFGLSEFTNIRVSIVICGTSFIALILAAFLRSSFPNFLTFLTALVMGGFTDFWSSYLGEVVNLELYSEKLIVFLVGILLLSFGIVIYIESKLPPNPNDDLVIAIKEKFNIKLGTSKLIFDAICIILALSIGGPIGIGTILATFAVGPLVNIIGDKVKL